MGVAGLGLVSDDAEDVGLALLGVDGIAQGFAIDGQALVVGGHLRIPALQCLIEGVGIDAGAGDDDGMDGSVELAVAAAAEAVAGIESG